MTQIPAHLLDMDGVLVRGGTAIDGSVEYVSRLKAAGVRFMLFTNNSRFSPRVHAEKLCALGFPITEADIHTSALATAQFLASQKPGATVFAVGDAGLFEALVSDGCRLVDEAPDFVVIGESLHYDYAALAHAAHLVMNGARFIGTNPDVNGPVEGGFHPACGAVCAMIQASSGKAPYFIGKPNPLMMRGALNRLSIRAANAIMVGDRMDTDVLAGLELGLQTALVLTGTSTRESMKGFPFRPSHVVPRLLDLAPVLGLE
ncbi:HAD-IIA family hydrolase [Stagnihabitans tardus]|uniref:HAD-IIA family hydrolase n=1 Tax=Stagnihabitans tardus TaxID=2699202 RepID=A0AAE4YCD0_9RHOB|nr:HAD-IIA family hydrolase [Stagnihabitans tardus]NBZ89409.1 HAD-IIA family hydrolase [Stagnihabitans tardus]